MTNQAPLKKIYVFNKEYNVLHLCQSNVDIETWVFPETQINVYGNDTSVGVLARIYDFVAVHKAVAYLERHSPDGADLVVFHGQSTPLNFRIAHQIKKAIHKAHVGKIVTLNLRPETKEDKMDNDWRFRETLSVRVEDHIVLVSGSTLGLRLLALECHNLTENTLGHQHFDWWSTKKSVEFIIRNKDRDK